MRRATGLLTLTLLLAGCAGTAPAEPKRYEGAATTAGSATTTSAAPSEESQQIAVDYAGGQVRGDTGRVPVEAGSAVTIAITSDVADEAHLHGYDLEAELAPGRPAETSFDATIPGVFELELHETGVVLLSLQVG
jgi:hypothetical protein